MSNDNDTVAEDLVRFSKLMDFFDCDNPMHIHRWHDDIARQVADRSSLYLEFMAAAFIKETGLPAGECELVMTRERTPGSFDYELTFYYRKRSQEQASWDKLCRDAEATNIPIV